MPRAILSGKHGWTRGSYEEAIAGVELVEANGVKKLHFKYEDSGRVDAESQDGFLFAGSYRQGSDRGRVEFDLYRSETGRHLFFGRGRSELDGEYYTWWLRLIPSTELSPQSELGVKEGP